MNEDLIKTQGKGGPLQAKEKVLEKSTVFWSWAINLKNFDDDKFLLFKPSWLRYFVMSALEN